MNTDVHHLKNLFAWVGLMHLLGNSSKEDFVSNLDNIQYMLLECMMEAKLYTGNNQEIRQGYQEMLGSIQTLKSFYPDLELHLS